MRPPLMMKRKLAADLTLVYEKRLHLRYFKWLIMSAFEERYLHHTG